MLTRNRVYANGSKYEGQPHEYFCLSTDTKPGQDDEIINGSTLYVMDTKEVYMWDEENSIWILQ